MGGRDAVVDEGRKAVENRNYGWAAEVLTHVTRIDPSDMEARKLKAEALRNWAHMQTNIYWRNFGLSGAAELDGTIDRSRPWNFSDPAIVRVLPTNNILETMRVRLNAEKAEGKSMTVAFKISDTDEASFYQVRNKIAAFKEGNAESADATFSGQKFAILTTIATGKIADGVNVIGDKTVAEEFLGLFDLIAPNGVNLLLPPVSAEDPHPEHEIHYDWVRPGHPHTN